MTTTGPATQRTVIIVQARMGSTRLPGKVLAPVLGRPLLQYQLERLARSQLATGLLVATTRSGLDDPVAALCGHLGVDVFRGPESDVLTRYAGAAAHASADIVVRSTADCPLIDPGVVDAVIARLLTATCDYASNTLRRTFPRGLDVEALSRSVLDVAVAEARDAADREHVTRFVYRRPERFRLCGVECSRDLSRERWTVDTPEDFELVRRIIEALYPQQAAFGLDDVVALLDAHPEWRQLNAEIEQKRA